MKLPVYSSRTNDSSPTYVRIQALDLDMLPSVLVCPLKLASDENARLTSVRVPLRFGDKDYIVYCDLMRPVGVDLLKPQGTVTGKCASRIMACVKTMLAL